jgi:hypothetical protein
MAIGWTALLLAACLAPSRWLGLREVPFHDLGLFKLDKIVHATLFAGYAFCWIVGERGRGATGRVLAVGLALAVLTELAQGLPFIRRDPDPFDALADVTGLAIGYTAAQVAMAIVRIARRRELDELSVES